MKTTSVLILILAALLLSPALAPAQLPLPDLELVMVSPAKGSPFGAAAVGVPTTALLYLVIDESKLGGTLGRFLRQTDVGTLIKEAAEGVNQVASAIPYAGVTVFTPLHRVHIGGTILLSAEYGHAGYFISYQATNFQGTAFRFLPAWKDRDARLEAIPLGLNVRLGERFRPTVQFGIEF